jgi:hypothetical protein
MPISHYALDKFVAPKLSRLTECGAPDIARAINWLNPFILNGITGARGRNEQVTAYAMTFLRRAEGAFASYRAGRAELLQYLENRTNNVISPYFRSLLNFETCIAQWCEGANLLKPFLKDKRYFNRRGQSKEKSITLLYNNDIKHVKIAKEAIPTEGVSPLWITNQGLEGRSGATLSFDELRQLLLEMAHVAEDISKQ